MGPGTIPDLNVAVKNTQGRQRIEMKKISNMPALQVTFSKRRSGIYKKASELSTLCGVELAIIMFSHNNRVFSFGSPNLNSIIQRYTGWAPPPPLNMDLNMTDLPVDVRELNTLLAHLSDQIVAKKKSKEDWDQLMKATENQFWYANPIENMNDDLLKIFKKKLKDLKTQVDEKREKLFFKSILTSNSPHHFAG